MQYIASLWLRNAIPQITALHSKQLSKINDHCSALVLISRFCQIKFIFFVYVCCLLLVMLSVNFDVCAIAFVTYLSNGVRFQLLQALSLDGFPTATTLFSLCCKV